MGGKPGRQASRQASRQRHPFLGSLSVTHTPSFCSCFFLEHTYGRERQDAKIKTGMGLGQVEVGETAVGEPGALGRARGEERRRPGTTSAPEKRLAGRPWTQVPVSMDTHTA